MTEKTVKILEILSLEYTNPKSELVFGSPFELLVAVILSAQCTDKRVNLVTPVLFKLANTPQKMAELEISQIEQIIHSCGFFRSKAKHISTMAKDVVNRFGGVVPNSPEDLQTLAGVGRKTANVVYAVAFSGQAIAVDTHVFRVANRLGLAKAKNVLQTEQQLMQQIDKNLWADSHHYLLLHGRYICKAQKPQCEVCRLQSCCDYFNQQNGK